jgi:predicted N-formylglutamate amidohydrolase
LKAPLFKTEVSRLLVEVNRSIGHEQLFSSFTKSLPVASRETLLSRFYFPYRNAVYNYIRDSKGAVLHVSIHTFTPRWNGKERKVDVGILFDPSRNFETQVSRELHRTLQQQLPSFHICDNEPYLGIDDGFTTYLRTHYPDANYAGLEIEVNQKYAADECLRIGKALGTGIEQIIRGLSLSTEGSRKPILDA